MARPHLPQAGLAGAGLALAVLAAAPASAQSTPSFMTRAQASDWRASKLVGVDILGTDNQKIGDVDDVILDGSGSVKAVVIGVGGFLGIGQKNIAVPFGAVHWTSQPLQTTATSVSTNTGIGIGGNGGATTGTGLGTAAPGGTAPGGTAPAGTAALPDNSLGGNSVPAAGTASSGPATSGGMAPGAMPPAAMAPAPLDYPDHGVLALSRDQLQSAPAFQYASEAK